MLSRSNRIFLALTEELIPGPFDLLAVLLDDTQQVIQRLGVEAVV